MISPRRPMRAVVERFVMCTAMVGCLLGGSRAAEAQEMQLTLQDQWPLFDNILAFDRSFDARAEDGVVVGVVYQSLFRPSLAVRSAVIEMINGGRALTLAGHDVRVVLIDLADAESLETQLRDEGIDVLYVSPLRGANLEGVTAMASEHGTATITGVREYVPLGVAVGLGQRGGRAEILVNLKSSKAQGMALRAQLLQIVTVLTETLGPT